MLLKVGVTSVKMLLDRIVFVTILDSPNELLPRVVLSLPYDFDCKAMAEEEGTLCTDEWISVEGRATDF